MFSLIVSGRKTLYRVLFAQTIFYNPKYFIYYNPSSCHILWIWRRIAHWKIIDHKHESHFHMAAPFQHLNTKLWQWTTQSYKTAEVVVHNPPVCSMLGVERVDLFQNWNILVSPFLGQPFSLTKIGQFAHT